MKFNFLTILAVVLVGLLIFYGIKLNFNEDLFSENNFAFTLSSMFAILGLISVFIFISAKKLVKK